MTDREVNALWMGEILNRLSESSPRGISLEMDDIIKATGTPDVHRPALLWHEIWTWLKREGLVVTHRTGGSSTLIEGAALTEKGFQALRRPIPGTEETVGEKLRSLMKAAGKEAAKTWTAGVISELIYYVMKVSITA